MELDAELVPVVKARQRVRWLLPPVRVALPLFALQGVVVQRVGGMAKAPLHGLQPRQLVALR